MSEYIKDLLILCPLIFFGGFVDSIAGGGGIITMPAYLLLGFPAHLAAGTNKAVSSCGTTVAAIKYIKNGSVHWPVAAFSVAGALLGGVIGSRLALLAPDKVLKAIILIVLPCIAVFLMLNRNFGRQTTSKNYGKSTVAVIAFFIGLTTGAYDGLVGPGAGTFLLMLFTGVLGLDLLTSASCGRVSNTASIYASLAVFLVNGSVEYSVFLPAAISSMLGNYLGSRYAIKGGSEKVRGVMFFVLVLIFAKMGYDFFFQSA